MLRNGVIKAVYDYCKRLQRRPPASLPRRIRPSLPNLTPITGLTTCVWLGREFLTHSLERRFTSKCATARGGVHPSRQYAR